MSRDIKFKSFNPDTNTMTSGHHFNTILMTTDKEFVDEFNGTWLEYTGLKCKNDKEIYEGDIVKVDYYTMCWGRKLHHKFTGFVELCEFEGNEENGVSDTIMGYGIKISLSEYESLANHNNQCEIIGNRYQNPNLI